jgi:hypothetical protein
MTHGSVQRQPPPTATTISSLSPSASARAAN